MIGAVDRSCDDDRSCGSVIRAVDRSCDDDRSCGSVIGALMMCIGL